jgi:hypothetical protein
VRECVWKNEEMTRRLTRVADQTRPAQTQTAVTTGQDKAVRRVLLKRATWIMLRWQSFGARRVGHGEAWPWVREDTTGREMEAAHQSLSQEGIRER